jgi:hypothetical protein
MESDPTKTRPRRFQRRGLRLVSLIILIYLGLVASMFFLQDQLLFHPQGLSDRLAREVEEHHGAVPWEVPVDGNTLRGYLVPGERREAGTFLLFFGGNGDVVTRRITHLSWLRDAGHGLAVVDYRGYGRSTGDPTGPALKADALSAFDTLVDHPVARGRKVVTWGFSLGAGLAVHVAHNRPVAGVVLLAPYDRLSDVGSAHFPWLPITWIFRHEIEPLEWAPHVRAPLLAWHGEDDRTIPIEHGERLRRAWAGPVTWHRVPGAGHVDVETGAFRQALLGFLDDLP